MTTIPQGKIATGALPAPGRSSDMGNVFEILVAPNPAATGINYFAKGAVVMAAWNAPGATGAMDPPLHFCSGHEDNTLDPTAYNVIGDGLFITYFVL